MAVELPRTILTVDQETILREQLCLQPKSSFNPFAKFSFTEQVKEPIIFYYLLPDATYDPSQRKLDDRPGNLLLPFHTAYQLLQKRPHVKREYPSINLQFKGQLFSHQEPVYDEALQHLETYGTTTISLYTGFGKTIVAIAIAVKLGLYTAILCNRECLTTQMKNSCLEYTNASVWVVGDKVPATMPDITICMQARYKQLPIEYRLRIGCLIIDEAHSWCTPESIPCILAWKPRYVIAMTATPRRADGMESVLHRLCGEHQITRISTKQFSVIKLVTGFTPEIKTMSNGRLDFHALIDDIVSSDYCNDIILQIVKENPDRKILCLTRVTKHIEILLPKLTEMGETVGTYYGNKKSYQDGRILLGTISKIGTGFDQASGACINYDGKRIDMLILMTTIKDQNSLEQCVGRAFRSESPIIVHIVHDNPTLKSHWNNCKKWYISRNGVINEITYAAPNKETTVSVPGGMKYKVRLNIKESDTSSGITELIE